MAKLSELIQFTEKPSSFGGIELTARLEWVYKFNLTPEGAAATEMRDYVKREAVERCFNAYFGEMEEKLREATRDLLRKDLSYQAIDETFRKLSEILNGYRK